MGAKAERLRRFRLTDPICYFCATRATETEDHVPSRECFRDRLGPEGFVFPACKICNNGAGQLEQVIALYVTMADYGERPAEQLIKLASGVANNNPDLLPKFELNANVARKHFRDKGMRLAPGDAYGQTPIATLPAGHRDAFDLFGRRLTCALYYKELRKPLPLDYFLVTGWLPWSEGIQSDAFQKMAGYFPNAVSTGRTNTDIGDQFSYEWGLHPDGEIFGFMAQFAHSYFFLGAAASPDLHAANNMGRPGWKKHAEDVVI